MATRKSGAFSSKPKEVAGTVRRSQVLTSYGPGALVDLIDHSVMIDGTGWWKVAAPTESIHDERLLGAVQSRLQGVVTLSSDTPFRLPPVPDDRAQNHYAKQVGITAKVFPEWMQCKQCGALARRRDFAFKKKAGGRGVYQHDCGPFASTPGYAVPVRFVAACENGHIDDVDWHYYVHHNSPPGGDDYRSHSLKLSESGSGDLAGVVVKCTTCNVSRGILDAIATNRPTLGKCRGQRRWLGVREEHKESCDKPLRLTVRTASDVWSPKVVSVLRLPNDLGGLQPAIDKILSSLRSLKPEFRLTVLEPLVQSENLTDAERDIVRKEVMKGLQGGPIITPDERTPEYERFSMAPLWQAGGQADPAEFLIEQVKTPPNIPGIDLVVTAHRLTELRALCGFTRLNTSALGRDGSEKMQAICEDGGWLPAIRVYGEGIFVRLDNQMVAEWARRDEVAKREDEFRAAWSSYGDFPGMPFILLHSLSHLLIQSLSLRCGYSASALRERLYVGNEAMPFYAVLIHTGAPGVDGTLGGLADESNRMAEHLTTAYHQARLCSNDPVCGSHHPGVGEGTQKLDGAACHSCLYVSESSCEHFNRGLDRALVFPVIGQSPNLAYFRDFASAADVWDDPLL